MMDLSYVSDAVLYVEIFCFFGLQSRSSSSRSGGGMECGVAAPGGFSRPHPSHPQHPALSPTERSPAKAGLHVNFSDKGEVR